MFDMIIKGGAVIDGTGSDAFPADVGILGARIAKIGRLSSGEGKRVIEAEGLAVSPGFIDMHSHEFTILTDPPPDSKIRQGVTTEVMGNCGESVAPALGAGREHVRSLLSAFGEYEEEIGWSGLAEFLSLLENRGLVNHYLPLVGHGTVRSSVMGLENRAPDSGELETMKRLVARSMEEGAWGLSSGLIYAPAMYARTEELIELAKVAAAYKGIYTSHIRGEHEGVLMSALTEAIRIGKEAGLPVEISHLKVYGKQLWGKAGDALKKLEEARQDGVDVTADAYPYVATHTTLKTVLPSWAQEGGTARMVERLKDASLRRKMREEMGKGEVVFFKGVDWDGVMLVKSNREPELDGGNIAEIAALRGEDPYQVVFDILVEEPGMRANYFALDEGDVQTILAHPMVMIGSDSYAVSDQGILGEGKPHPRGAGTFPRVLGKYVREENLFRLEEAVRKMTSFPARKLGLKDRGRIEEGAFADLVLFDPEKVADRATFVAPQRYPRGIEYVLLDGEVVVESGEYTKQLVGKVLRHA